MKHKRDDPCAEFADVSDRDIEARLQKAGAGWTPDKVKRAEQCLEARALTRKRTEQAEQTEIARSAKNAAWVAIGISIVSALIATAGLVVAVIALLKRVGPS